MPVFPPNLLSRFRHAVLRFGLAACLALPAGALAALAPLLSDYSHTTWGPPNGAPNDVVQFAQTSDGWLWLSSPNGLFRFDGVRFERVDSVHGQRLHSPSVVGLLATPDGALWIGHRFGGVSQLKNGRLTVYPVQEDLRDGAVFSLARGPDGAIWISDNTVRLRREADGSWTRKSRSCRRSPALADGSHGPHAPAAT